MHIPIIDTHQHLWDLKQFSPPWLKDPSAAALNRPATFKEYAAATAGLNVVKTVYMEVDVAPAQQTEEAQWVSALCKGRKTLMRAGVISARPASPDFARYLFVYKNNPYIKGVRQVLQVPSAPRGLCLTPDFVRSIQLCGKWGKTFDICIRPEELSDAAKLIDRCPQTRFVLDHCGNGAANNPNQAQWERDIQAIAKRKNVVCKISGIIKTVPQGADPVEALRPIVRPTLDAFGPDRVMFGGDWPVCNLGGGFKVWVETLDALTADASEGERRKLYHDNAARFYGLK